MKPNTYPRSCKDLHVESFVFRAEERVPKISYSTVGDPDLRRYW